MSLDSLQDIIKRRLNTDYHHYTYQQIRESPTNCLLGLILYEHESLNEIASWQSPWCGFDDYYSHFEKKEYQKGETVKFTLSPSEFHKGCCISFDSVRFSMKGQEVQLDYSLKQYISTAMIEFTPPKEGFYHVTVFITNKSKSLYRFREVIQVK